MTRYFQLVALEREGVSGLRIRLPIEVLVHVYGRQKVSSRNRYVAALRAARRPGVAQRPRGGPRQGSDERPCDAEARGAWQETGLTVPIARTTAVFGGPEFSYDLSERGVSFPMRSSFSSGAFSPRSCSISWRRDSRRPVPIEAASAELPMAVRTKILVGDAFCRPEDGAYVGRLVWTTSKP